MNVATRTLAVAAVVALASACSDERSQSTALNDSGGASDGGEPTHASGRGGGSSEGGADVAVAGESIGGNATAGVSAEPLGGGDTAGPDGRAGAGGEASGPVGQLPQVDVWLAGKPTYGAEFRAALRAVAIESELLLASTDDTALEAARAFLLARQCAYFAKLGAPPWQMADLLAVREALGELRAIELNSWQRSEKYVHAHQAASGHTFPLVAGVDLAARCEQLQSEVAR